jgi:septum formation protein
VIVRPSDVDESTPADWSPQKVVEQLALRKALRIAEQATEDAVVVGSDTIVVLGDQILGKPTDRADAIRMLAALQGQSHIVMSGVACVDVRTRQHVVIAQSTNVVMKPLRLEQIARYVDSGEPMDKAGSYAIQGLGAMFIERIEGCYFNVVGLPIAALADVLKRFDIDTY